MRNKPLKPGVAEAIAASGERAQNEIIEIQGQLADLLRLLGDDDTVEAAKLARVINGRFRAVADLTVMNARKDHSIREIAAEMGLAHTAIQTQLDTHLAGEKSVESFKAKHAEGPSFEL